MQYRSEIDGLRAVAVLPVIFFHAGFDVFSGGFAGVDVFFVISGFLITSILIDELEREDFSVARFYERRARRILPALFVVLLACIPFAWMWMLPSEMKNFSKSVFATVLFSSNILFWMESGYFDTAAELKPLLHTWSLAVEEQYYLLFPLFLLLLWRFGRSRVIWVIAAIALASFLLSEYGWRNHPGANFFLAPTRVWELLAGSICAFLAVNGPPRANNVLSVAGLALIVFSIFYYDSSTPFPSIYALAPVVGTALVLLYARSETVVARLLSTAPFVGIGLISYSAYLWHQPLFAFARIRSLTEPSQPLMAALAAASLALAVITWKFVEQPLRRNSGVSHAGRKTFACASAGLAIVLFGGVILKDGFEFRYWFGPHFEAQFRPHDVLGLCERPPIDDAHNATFCRLGDPKKKLKMLVFGDSHSSALNPMLHALGKEQGFSYVNIFSGGCPPCWMSTWQEEIGARAFASDLLIGNSNLPVKIELKLCF